MPKRLSTPTFLPWDASLETVDYRSREF